MASGINALAVNADKFEASTKNNRSEINSNNEKSFDQVFDETNRNNDVKKTRSNEKDISDSSKKQASKTETNNTSENQNDSVVSTDHNSELEAVTDDVINNPEGAITLSGSVTESPLIEDFIADLQAESEPVGSSILLSGITASASQDLLNSGVNEFGLQGSRFSTLSSTSFGHGLLSKNTSNTNNTITTQLSGIDSEIFNLDSLELNTNLETSDNNLLNSKFSSKLDSLISGSSQTTVGSLDVLNSVDNKVSQYITGQLGNTLGSAEGLKVAAPTTSLFVGHNLTSPAWGADVAEKVLWLASQGLTEAEIQLDPPELGPLQARVVVNNDQAQVTFNSHSSQVRDALDQTANRLRELFSQEGLNLVDVNVSSQSGQERQQHADGKLPSGTSSDGDGLLEQNSEAVVTPVNTRANLVDSYA